jgi:hypothetical protein
MGRIMGFWSRRKGVTDDIKETPDNCLNKYEEGKPVLPVEEPEKSTKKLKIPLNKTTSDVKYILKTIVFPCPICSEINTVDLSELDPIMGGETMCVHCQVVLHIPGGYLTHSEVPKLKVYAGLPVAVRKFPLFYWNHPVINDLEQQGITRIIIQYGLWGFCQRCHHQFSPAVLINLPHTSGEIVDYRSLSSEEMNEMKSLRAGCCPYCSHRILLVIISDVPHYVISASENLAHRWEED